MALNTKNNAETVSAIERRKVKNYWARVTLSWGIVATFLILIYLLFFTESTDDNHMQLINILVLSLIHI